MMITEKIEKLPILRRVTADARAMILNAATVRELKAGELVFLEEEKADTLYWQLSGKAKLWVSSGADNDTVLEVHGAGDVLGLASFFEHDFFGYNLQCMEDSSFLCLERDAFAPIWQSDVHIQLAILAKMSVDLRVSVREINNLKLKNTSKRLGVYLLSLAPDLDEVACDIVLPTDKRLLAARLAMKPESLSRAFAKLKSFGVESRKDFIRLGNLSALQEFCGEDDILNEVGEA